GVYLGLAPSGLILYMGYLWVRFGEPLLFYTEQKDWNREPTGPLQTLTLSFERSWESLGRLFGPLPREGLSAEQLLDRIDQADSAYGLLLLALALALILAGSRTLPLGLSAYAFLVAVFPAFFGTPDNPLMGLPRYLLVAFPLFIVLGVLLENRWLLAVWLAVSTGASLVLCALFITWRYVA
ncbi:MAG: hypothetical protein M3N10_04390, partial [Actinomycetota bacterium]|nr:hypothetical protein [Actinomycetota bacterium]